MEYLSKNEKETLKQAESLSKLLKPGDIVCLFGDLGSGKTTFTKGVAEALKVKKEDVNSPTFTLLNIYRGKYPLYHFDLYRMESRKEILELGYEEFFYGEGVTLVEWAEKLKDLTPKEYLKVELSHQGPTERLIKIEPVGEKYRDFKIQ
ncbi:MAG: tRNA (adenosine(37)-N6)-threonylcarbamoyltransferase complex ATPase subunit type 1 TsaE [Omnitrophica WOR_2 bacterium GWA2_47_8]|nr:MAG: tRNA (adenosine(37)-N6)-threonylcarbamoyltransferase complex ATPase subunit type 1 TsaE [Omnitrophica WOR_2 bacterium GWA2_47_8]